jgi:site-specific DNA-methyltransferase (adenine-specific)
LRVYYQDYWATIYHGDCRDVLPIDGMDLVLTDPPFGIEGGVGGDAKDYGKGDYSGAFPDTPSYIAEVVVPVIEDCIAFYPAVIVTSGIRNLWKYPQAKDMGCMWNPAAATHGPWGMGVFSPILYYGKDWRAGKGALPTGKQCTERSEKNGHPCVKPMNLWKWLLDKGCPEGSTVLDPFMGSGTTLRAAKDLNRKSIGIEIEEKYCEIAANRLAQEVLDFT